MRRKLLTAKLHGIRVTGAELHYEGSIALDPAHCERAGLLPFEFVDIWNKSSGARISTYVILGRRGSGCCVLNGAAARTCQVGDELIIAASADVEDGEIDALRPRVLVYGERNRIVEVIDSRIVRRRDGRVAVQRLSTRRR